MKKKTIKPSRKVGLRRLAKLARHLKSENLGHYKFDISCYSAGSLYCGSSGCALGECPFVFPKSWRFILFQDPICSRAPVLKSEKKNISSDLLTFCSANTFFVLSDAEVRHLFFAFEQDTETYGGCNLTYKATPADVAYNIEQFIKKQTL